MSVRNITLHDMRRISVIIPDKVKIAIADVVIAFSLMEAEAEQFIWAICDLSFEDGSLFTAMDARPKFALLKKLVASRKLVLPNPPLPSNFWETVDDLRTYRNEIAHGQWIMVDQTIPATASFRDKDQAKTRVVSTAYSIERMEAIARQCGNVRHYFSRLREALAKKRAGPSRPPREQS